MKDLNSQLLGSASNKDQEDDSLSIFVAVAIDLEGFFHKCIQVVLLVILFESR